MDKKIIDDIVWYIPFKKLRNALRNYLYFLIDTNQLKQDINDINNTISNLYRDTMYFNRIISEYHINMLLKLPKYSNEKRLERYGFQVYSQNEEDGMINEIFNRIGTTNKFFIEFGVQSGLESNTHFLLFNGWKGIFIEGSEGYYKQILNNFKEPIKNKKLTVLNKFITAENINDIINSTEAYKINDIDLLSIDIDGNDYHVFKAIDVINPRVVVIEYNTKFPPPSEYIMPYNPEHCWDYTDIQGASLQSLTKLANEKGYSLVATTLTGVNAFFVKNELIEDKFCDVNDVQALHNPYRHRCITFYKGIENKYYLDH